MAIFSPQEYICSIFEEQDHPESVIFSLECDLSRVTWKGVICLRLRLLTFALAFIKLTMILPFGGSLNVAEAIARRNGASPLPSWLDTVAPNLSSIHTVLGNSRDKRNGNFPS
jgi:hypothetical protein